MSRPNTPDPRTGARSKKLLALAIGLLALPATLIPPASAEVVQKRGVRLSVKGSLVPDRLPRTKAAPVAVNFGGRVFSNDPGGPPQLTGISVAINRHGRVDVRGLPSCRIDRIDPSTTREAISACRRSLVGEGSFSANVKLPQQSPFPSDGKILAFHGRFGGRPAVLAHIYGTKPVPTSIVLPFSISKRKGTFGTLLRASLPRVTGDWGYVTGLDMTLKRRYRYRGKSRSYMSAICPVPAGFRQAVFPMARASFSFDGGLTLTSTLERSCRAR